MLQDAHSHIQDSVDAATVNELLRDISAAGIKRIFCDSASPQYLPKLERIAHQDGILPFFGLHPWYIADAPVDWMKSLKELLVKFPSCAIGEIGLDKGDRGADFALQKKVFSAQLDLAIETRKPVTLHCVKAWEELLTILKHRGPKLPPMLMHAFSGPPEALDELISINAFISFSPQALSSGNPRVTKMLSLIPKEKLLLETDFPYRYTGEINSAAYLHLLSDVYTKAAGLLRVERAELEERIWNNGTLFTHGITAR
ncbi:MAG: TatD family hydrolase [Candidatus Omnitrophota bacterium]|jgi:TatD DNase family protein